MKKKCACNIYLESLTCTCAQWQSHHLNKPTSHDAEVGASQILNVVPCFIYISYVYL